MARPRRVSPGPRHPELPGAAFGPRESVIPTGGQGQGNCNGKGDGIRAIKPRRLKRKASQEIPREPKSSRPRSTREPLMRSWRRFGMIARRGR
jgi:hypothetical protein